MSEYFRAMGNLKAVLLCLSNFEFLACMGGVVTKEHEGHFMSNDDRRLFLETIAEMKELKGAMAEFKEHVMGRVEKLEKIEGDRSKERISVLSILIAGMALAVSIIVNFFRNGR